ncbi:mycothiol acetyltransferase [Knoellia sinensis KCTC 19936]|uniref:Mycothiol acetyltransferase n=1 Tax=Knoellia sinensis KCTC 19936 TaxID=1385520 RepID=A0A0A0JE33_9MICO|nr:mycothiol synthase [Knoellia sinensis]KGN34327.1 mycothiol acetyltransferase [Knoellia sinensis KCTC 19936]
MSDFRIESASSLDEPSVASVLALIDRAADADGVEAISEAFRLALGSPRASVTHFVAYAAESPSEGLLGYAAVDTSGSAELVVDPPARRQGVGRALLRAVFDGDSRADFVPDWDTSRRPKASVDVSQSGTKSRQVAVGVWAHGNLPAAQALAASAGLVSTRELHVMARAVVSGDVVDPVLPEGFSVRAFEPGRDEQAWLEVNGLAFASHPEQGSITLADLRDRMAQDWFDPAGFLLVEDTTVTESDGQHPLAAFHWTKREPGSTTGEVYVVGVHPAYQGKGLAGPLTGLGTAYLARQGVEKIELYVDGDNTRALATYRRAGFEDAAIHVVYGRPDAP